MWTGDHILPGKLYYDDATYERMKLHRYRYHKMLEETEQIEKSIEEAVANGDKEVEALLRQERTYLIKAKNTLDEYVNFLESLCFVKRDEDYRHPTKYFRVLRSRSF